MPEVNTSQSLGLTWGKVVKDEETGRPKVSQKVMGVDISEFISGIKEVKQAESKIFKDKIDVNTKKIAAYTELQTKLTTLQDQASKLSNSLYDRNSANNMFNSKVVQTSDVGNGVQADPAANLGTFTYKVNQLATSDLRASSTPFAAANTALGLSGTLNVGTVIPGSSVAIPIDTNMTLSNVAASINAQSATTKVYAEVVANTSGTYQLKIKAQTPGTPIVLTDSGGVMTGLHLNKPASSTLSGTASATNESTALNLSGNLSLTGNLGTDSVAIDNTMSIQGIVDAINTKTGTTGVTALLDIVYSGTSSKAFQIKLSTTNPTNVVVSDDGNVVSGLKLDKPITDYNALAAIIEVDDVIQKRSSNTITDAIGGVTFTLKNADQVKYTADVQYDRTGVFTALDTFVTSYNELNKFYGEQTASKSDAKGNKKALEGANLFGDLWVQQLMVKVKQVIRNPVPGVNPDLNVFKQLGLEFYDNVNNKGGPEGELFLKNSQKFYNALNNQYEELRKFFGDYATSSNYLFQVREIPPILDVKGIAGKNVTFSYTNTAGTLSAKFTLAGVDYPAVIDNSGYVITGTEGTPFEGVTVNATSLLAPNTTQTATLVMTQGIMSELKNYLESVIKEPVLPDRSDAGELLKKMDGLTTQNNKSQKRIDQIDKMAAAEVKRLEAQFQRVYAASLQYESILNMVQSLISASK